MTAQPLDEPVVAGAALRQVNFFNGRLLTGDDLRLEQGTGAARLARAGRAIGGGIAHGFELVASAASTNDKPAVTVEAGLAMAPSGMALELAGGIDISLIASNPPSDAERGGLFAECQPFAAGTYSAGSGVYLLAVGPASQPEGLAPVSGLGNESARCNVARFAEALRFRLIRLAIDPATLVETALLRSRVAAACFGFDALSGFAADPFGAQTRSWGLVDVLRAQMLAPDEVALAVIGWSVDDGIQFVDQWSVRRRIAGASAADEWLALIGRRRSAEVDAIFLQFQAHVEDLISGPSPETLVAGEYFEWLPPIGLLPVTSAIQPGIVGSTFFGQIPTRGPCVLEAAKLEALVRRSLSYAPVSATSGELLWLYEIRENLVRNEQILLPEGPCLVFTSAFVPYAANAQYELARWNHANYALHAN